MICENETFDQERAFYGAHDLTLKNCRFDGPADGESALKECQRIQVEDCYCNLRYPFWHDTDLSIRNTELTENCRAALWYADHVQIDHSKLNGIKAVRECVDVRIFDCTVNSPEFGWSVRSMIMSDTEVTAEYFMMRSSHLLFDHVTLHGKYSFQYVENATLDDCNLDTKDAFWHSKNVTVRNSVIKGEYLAWYSENLTLINCTIIGTQPLCYCKNLQLINCRMVDTDLAFERSDVRATLTEPIDSIKNPLSGTIEVPAAGELIYDIDEAKGRVVFTESQE